MKGQTGIWIDGKKAIIVHLREDTRVVDVLESDVEYRKRYPGESRIYTRFGSQFLSNEEKASERLHHERNHFLHQVMEKLDPEYDIVIFGPAQTKHELIKVLTGSHDFTAKPITLKPADSMTVNQFVDLVNEYYHGELA
jgi:tRNA U38,U39,U40 pseudouridine synthase TruA